MEGRVDEEGRVVIEVRELTGFELAVLAKLAGWQKDPQVVPPGVFVDLALAGMVRSGARGDVVLTESAEQVAYRQLVRRVHAELTSAREWVRDGRPDRLDDLDVEAILGRAVQMIERLDGMVEQYREVLEKRKEDV